MPSPPQIRLGGTVITFEGDRCSIQDIHQRNLVTVYDVDLPDLISFLYQSSPTAKTTIDRYAHPAVVEMDAGA